jgi:amidase
MGNIDGLPVGILFYAEAWSEGKLINIAYTFEQKNPQRLVPKFKN